MFQYEHSYDTQTIILDADEEIFKQYFDSLNTLINVEQHNVAPCAHI